MGHVVLLGDSIFDNGAYTDGGPDVVTQLRELLPAGWHATLGAVDGTTTDDFATQLDALPDDATHFVVSLGGNDALGHVDLLDRHVHSSAEALSGLGAAAQRFEKRGASSSGVGRCASRTRGNVSAAARTCAGVSTGSGMGTSRQESLV